MKLTKWFSILILYFTVSLQKHAETTTHLFRKAKQCKGSEMSCERESDCCSGICLVVNASEEEEMPEKQCYCSPNGIYCEKKKHCCDSKATCVNKRCTIVEESVCGKACAKGIECPGSCPLCNGICVKSTAKCDEPCPSGSSYECKEGGLCRNKICKCGSGCKLSRAECNDANECCKKSCERIGESGGRKICA